MKLVLLFLFYSLIFFTANAQVGIGTTGPDASSVLDITATDKGILIPRVSLDNVSTIQLDGVNTAASGLLIWNTNAATVGGSGIGFYYFDGIQFLWVALGGNNSDADWYEQGTTNAPNAITDNIFTNGAVGINTFAFASRQLNVEAGDLASEAGYFTNFSSTSGVKTGIRTFVSSDTNAPKYGVYNSLGSISNSGILYGTFNQVFGANNEGRYGTYNDFSGSGAGNNYGVYSNMNPGATGNIWGTFNNIINDEDGDKVGVHNRLIGSGGRKYGTLNQITANSERSSYGSFNSISGTGSSVMHGAYNTIFGAGSGTKYGSYNLIHPVTGGTHFGVYSQVLKPASFAGYFRGNLAIGTTAPTDGSPDFYILPPSRGTANQIMQTNGTGITSWVDNPAIVTTENGLSESASVVRLGGTLNQNTSIVQGTFNLDYNLSDSGDFNVQDNGVTHFQVRDDGNSYFGGEAIVTASDNINGNRMARLFNIFDEEGALYLYRNGMPQHRLDAGFITIFNDQGVDIDFRIESDTNPLAFGVNAGENVMYAGTDIVSLTNNGATVNGVTVEYVASFYRDDLTNGTAIQMGSTEYITDFGNLIWGPYGAWAPYSDNTFDLGTSTFRWDDVYATSGIVNTSDIRLKKNIKDLSYGLDEVMKLEPITYQWKNSRNPSEVKIGFSAQQLLSVIPEVVKTHEFVYPDENGPGVLQENENLGVYYSDIIPVLTKAIQEQQLIIENLKRRLETLESKI
ncbi:MAG: tail fiber domain-containing protein [Flavobacteriaceae bacterium]|nr:tail fiber domain-containing protein [Flavobacteriaceae bacterium]